MALLHINSKNCIVFASNNKLLIFPDGKRNQSKLLNLTYSSKTSEKSEEEKVNNDAANKSKEKEVSQCIVCGSFSSSGNYFAVIDDVKQLHLWHVDHNQEFSLISVRTVARKCVTLKFTYSEDFVLTADRSGDVYSFSVKEADQAGILLLGHLSMLLNMVITPEDKYIISCDRDEKIRVSCYPNSYSIHSYCLGHKKFVNFLSVIPLHPELLISGSGDGTFKIWLYREGICIYEQNYLLDISNLNNITEESVENNASVSKKEIDDDELGPENELTCSAVKQIKCSPLHNVITAIFDRLACVVIYHYNFEGSHFSLTKTQVLEYSAEPWMTEFDNQGWLWVLLPIKQKTLEILMPCHNEHAFEFRVTDEVQRNYHLMISVINNHWEFFSESLHIQNDFDMLQKKWYDNVGEYQEKKEQRQQKKKLKSHHCTKDK